MRKIILLLIAITLLMAGCSSGKLINGHTSVFDQYSAEQTDTAYTVKGTVEQENDGNAIVLKIHAEKDATVAVKGSMKRKSGGDTQLTYVAPDGTASAIADSSADSSSDTVDSAVSIKAGDSMVQFLGDTAVYDFELHFSLADGVSYSGGMGEPDK